MTREEIVKKIESMKRLNNDSVIEVLDYFFNDETKDGAEARNLGDNVEAYIYAIYCFVYGKLGVYQELNYISEIEANEAFKLLDEISDFKLEEIQTKSEETTTS